MTKICSKFLVAIILLISGSAFSQSERLYDSKIKSFLDNLEEKSFTGVILVAQDDQIIENRAFGMASLEYDVKNGIGTKFNIASITKLFTAVSILQLYEKGQVELHTPIKKYLPTYPNKTVRDSVTVHQLLTHTSGNNNFYVENFLGTEKSQYKSISDFVQLFAKDSLLSNPGTKYDYSASGFVILGLIIESVSGLDYYEYVRKNIFASAKMKNTSELEIDSVVPNKSSGYTTLFGENKIPKRNDYYLSKASPGGFHYSTAEDLFNFSKSLHGGILLKKKTLEMMLEPKVEGYYTHLGYGVSVDTRYNQTIIGHSGGWYGIQCELMDFMRDDYTVVILSNMDTGEEKGTSMVSNFFMELIADKNIQK